MLPADAANRGANFLTPAIFAEAQARVSEGSGAVEPFRLLHNMLSSQPLCFNLFAPLRRDLSLATTLLRKTFGDRIGAVTDVKIEYAPMPANEYLGDRTAFDVFISFRTPEEEPGFLGIEVKLTELFSEREYDGARYRELTARPGSPWRPEANGMLSDPRWNQLWRDHLLVEAIRSHPSPRHGTIGSLVIVRHPLDETCETAVGTYRTLLSQPEDLIDLRLDHLIEGWRSVAESDATRRWLDDLSRRYVAMDESEEGWLQSAGGKHR